MAEVEPLEWQNLDGYLGNEDENKCLVLLDQLTNPQNIGSILRTASAFEVDGVVVTKRNTPIENGLMARSAAGAIETMPLIRISNLSRTIEYLKNNNFLVVGLEKNGVEDVKKISSLLALIDFAIFDLDKSINLFDIHPWEWDSECGLPNTFVKNGIICL